MFDGIKIRKFNGFWELGIRNWGLGLLVILAFTFEFLLFKLHLAIDY